MKNFENPEEVTDFVCGKISSIVADAGPEEDLNTSAERWILFIYIYFSGGGEGVVF